MPSVAMSRAYAFLFILAVAFSLGQCFKLHKRMTEGEIHRTFDSSPGNIPSYHVVPVAHALVADSRGDRRAALRILANGESVYVYLESNNDSILAAPNTPVMTAYTQSDGRIVYNSESGAVLTAATVYTTRTGSLVAYAKRSTDKLSFIGHIGDMHIRPVPSRLRRTTEQDLPSSDGSWSVTHDHILFSRSKSASPSLTEALNKEYDLSEESSLFDESHRSQGKRSIQSIVYPSLMITTAFPDADLNPSTGLDEEKRLEALEERVLYLLAFWNGVDLRFRALKDPKVRLRIAIIVIGTDEKATPYLEKNGDRININTVITNMVKYWTMHASSSIPENLYHGIVTMTNQDFSDGSLGISTFGNICRLAGSVATVAVIHDNMAFQGILTAARQVGHFMGASYDVSDEETCRKSDGYIMSPDDGRHTEVNIRWSSCSLRNFTNFFRQSKTTCIDKPTRDLENGVARLLPGKYLSANAQCRALGFTAACKDVVGRCKNLRCYDVVSGSVQPESFSAPAEGTTCGWNQICLDGECVFDPQPNKYTWDSRNNEKVLLWVDEASNLICPEEE